MKAPYVVFTCSGCGKAFDIILVGKFANAKPGEEIEVKGGTCPGCERPASGKGTVCKPKEVPGLFQYYYENCGDSE